MRFRLTYHLSLVTYHFKVKRGFTLIELLVVISIIAILVASATASWRNAQMKGRDGKRKVDLKAVQQALENYIQTNGKYPASSTGQIACNVTGDSSFKTWGGTFTCGPINYMQQIPQDSSYQATAGYYFASCGSPPTSYALFAAIENLNDPELSTLPTPCATAPAGRNYWVINP